MYLCYIQVMNSDHIRDIEGARAVWEVKSGTKEGWLGKKVVGRNASLFNIKIEISIYLILKRQGFFSTPFLFTFQTSLAPLCVYCMRLLGLMSHAQQLVSSDDT